MDFIGWGSRLVGAIRWGNTCGSGNVANYCWYLRLLIAPRAHDAPRLLCFFFCVNTNQVRGKEKLSPCASPLLSVRVVYDNILNLLPKQTHKWLHSTINHPPSPPPHHSVWVDGSSVWFHTWRSSMWLTVRLHKTPVFLQFITRFPGN